MWNAHVSAAFMVPLHICEVVTRNAISDVLEAVYGAQWPWSVGFETSLPNPARGYRTKDDLLSARRHQPCTGNVIPELKFVFWQKMLTSRFDHRLWNTHIFNAFPNALSLGYTQNTLRQKIHDDLETVRKLRNRIAHHEPVFSRNLHADLTTIKKLISFRCNSTSKWLNDNQRVLRMLTRKPGDRDHPATG